MAKKSKSNKNNQTKIKQKVTDFSEVLNVDKVLQFFLLGAISLIVVLMSLAYKTSSSVWRGIHDTLVYKNSITEVLVALSLLGFIGFALSSRKFVVPKDKLTLSMALLIAIAIASFFWSEHPGYATHKILMWVAAYAVFFLCLQFVYDHKLRDALLRVVFVSAVIIAFIGLLQALFDYKGVPQATAPASTFSNKNMACHPIILSFSLGLYFLYGAPKRHFAIDLFYALCMTILLAFLFHTETRSAWLATAFELVAVVLLWFVFLRNKSQHIQFYQLRRIATWLGLFLLIVVMSLKHNPESSTNLSWQNPVSVVLAQTNKSVNDVSGGAEGSLHVRKRTWQATQDAIKDKPLLGFGMGNFYSLFPKYYLSGGESIRRVHNDYLEMISEIGFVGFAFFLACVAFALLYAWRILRSEQMSKEHLLLICILAMFVGTAENAFLSFPYFHITPMILMAIYAAIIVSMYQRLRYANDLQSSSAASENPENKSNFSLIDLKTRPIISIACFVFMLAYVVIAIRAKYHVEVTMEKQWTQQIKNGVWEKLPLSEPKWLETTHYAPVLRGQYGQLVKEYQQLQKAAAAEKDWTKRAELRKRMNQRKNLATSMLENLREHSIHYPTMMALVNFYLREKEYTKAESLLKQIKPYEGKGGALTDLSYVNLLRAQKKPAEAVKHMDQTMAAMDMEYFSSVPHNYLRVGREYLVLGRREAALNYFKQGFQRYPDIAAYPQFIATTYISQGNKKAAAPYMKAYLEYPRVNAGIANVFKRELQTLGKQ